MLQNAAPATSALLANQIQRFKSRSAEMLHEKKIIIKLIELHTVNKSSFGVDQFIKNGTTDIRFPAFSSARGI